MEMDNPKANALGFKLVSEVSFLYPLLVLLAVPGVLDSGDANDAIFRKSVAQASAAYQEPGTNTYEGVS